MNALTRSTLLPSLRLSLLVLASCAPPIDDLADGMIELPPILREVSGMVAIDEHTIAAVQDEDGAVFFVDLRGLSEVRSVSFGPPGDFEGIAYTGEEFWVLRSDGVLLRLAMHGEALAIAERHTLPERCEYEGLCYDAENRRLLVLPKGAISDKKRERRRRRVFAFDLVANRAVEKPDDRGNQPVGRQNRHDDPRSRSGRAFGRRDPLYAQGPPAGATPGRGVF